MDKKKSLKSVFISILICTISAGTFAIAIILTAPKKEVAPTVPKAPVAAKINPNAIAPQSLIGTWEMTSPKLGSAQITFENDGSIKFKSNGMNMLGKYSEVVEDNTIKLEITGIVDDTVTLTGEMVSPEKIYWREIKGWDLGKVPLEWVKK